MIVLTETNIGLFEELSKKFGIELFKVADGYFVKHSVKSISEEFEIGDGIEYSGRINPVTQIVSIYNKIKKLEQALVQLNENTDVRIENSVVNFIRIVKNNNKYESREVKMSFSSFINMIETVQKIILNNKLDSLEKIQEYVNGLDSASDEWKSVKLYLDLTEQACFSFILMKHDHILGESRETNRIWYVSDTNDVRARELYDFCDEFKVALI